MTTTNKYGPLGVAHLCGELKVIQEPAAQHVATMTDRPGADEYARLIAAAPGLLFLLELCMAEDQTDSGISIELIRECRAMIDGVKG